jgi:hypothetical protein
VVSRSAWAKPYDNS